MIKFWRDFFFFLVVLYIGWVCFNYLKIYIEDNIIYMLYISNKNYKF